MQQQKQSFQFAELNLRHRGNPERTLALVRRAIRMGYDSVAINVDIGHFGEEIEKNQNDEDEEAPKSKKRKKERKKQQQQQKNPEEETVPDPFLVDEAKLVDDLSTFRTTGRRFRQFSRLTVSLEANSIHRLLHHKKVRLYDILAVRVPDEQVLLTLQRKGDFVDLISLDEAVVTTRGAPAPWLFKQKIVQSCIAAGLTFELCYAHALASSEHRRQFFSISRRLMEITRAGRSGVVLSSGAEEMLQLRAPFDVANLCTLLGLAPKCGRRFVASNARAVLLRAQTRRHTVKGAIHVVNLADVPSISAGAKSAFVSDSTIANLANIEEFAAEMEGEKAPEEADKMEQEQDEKGQKVVEEPEKSRTKSAKRKRKRQRTGGEEQKDGRVGGKMAEKADNLFEIFT